MSSFNQSALIFILGLLLFITVIDKQKNAPRIVKETAIVNHEKYKACVWDRSSIVLREKEGTYCSIPTAEGFLTYFHPAKR